MTIISTNMLADRIPGSPASTDLTLAVNRANGFVNTWAKNYDPFDDYQESPEAILAPAEIGSICLEVAEAEYYLEIGEVQRDGNDSFTWHDFKELKKEQLKEINIEPTWETQTISLNSDYVMVIGSRSTTGGMWPRVIPHTAQVISASGDASVQWIQPDDWHIVLGGDNISRISSSQFPDAWYFVANRGSSVEGTLRYMRTYRNDAKDYMRYDRNV